MTLDDVVEIPESTAQDLIKWLYECTTCGKEHRYRILNTQPFKYGTWADPDDGHGYVKRLNWLEGDLRALWAEHLTTLVPEETQRDDRL